MTPEQQAEALEILKVCAMVGSRRAEKFLQRLEDERKTNRESNSAILERPTPNLRLQGQYCWRFRPDQKSLPQAKI